MGVRLTHDEYVKKLHEINPNVMIVDEYVNRRTKSTHRCLVDGYEWNVSPGHLLQGTGCPLCAGKIKTTKVFMDEMSLKNPNIEVIGEYISAKTKILCRCKLDGYEWFCNPTSLLAGVGCPVCSNVKKKTTEEYIESVNLIDENIIVVGEYINAKTKIMHQCAIDGHMWLMDPHHILSGRGCPVCKSSKGEKEIAKYLNSRNIKFETQYTFSDCKNVFCLPFDFYLPEYNVCIEYDGIQHFTPIDFFGGQAAFEIRKKNDNIKSDYCKTHSIKLLRVRYDQEITNSLNVFLSTLTILN